MESVVLNSGRTVEIRPITAGDADALAAAYLRLSPESRYQRFFAMKPRLTAADLRYLTVVDGDNHFAMVVTEADDPCHIIAVGRFVRLSDDPTAAEFAITVGDPYQREGIATLLVERLADIAAGHGIRHATATMLAANLGAHRLMYRLAARLAERSADAPLPSERHLGLTDEIVVELAF